MTHDWDGGFGGGWPFSMGLLRPSSADYNAEIAAASAWQLGGSEEQLGASSSLHEILNPQLVIREGEGVIGNVSDPRIVWALGRACGLAARAVREGQMRSAAKVKEGQLASREEGFTDDLADAIDTLGRVIEEQLATLATRITSGLPGLRVEFKTQKAKAEEEELYGLDLGIRMIVSMDDYTTEKAILIQCKRMTDIGVEGTFPTLAGRGERQAKRMLKTTPASFFFLFNAGEAESLLNMVRTLPVLLTAPLAATYEYFDPGVTVLPAARVVALSKAAKEKGRTFPTGAREMLAGSIPFGHFIASLFAPCFIGDPRANVVRIATPPMLRPAPEAPAKRTKRRAFHARRAFEFKVTKGT